MTATIRHPPTGLVYWGLIYTLKSRLNARPPLDGKALGLNIDVLVVQVGPAAPYRLLTVEAEADGLIRMQLWEAKRKVDLVADTKTMSDLVPEVLTKWVSEFGLS